MTQKTGPQEVASLHKTNCFDLIRLLAAFGVLYSHSYSLTGSKEPTFYGGESLGALSVFVFFSISGYLVLLSWDRTRNPFLFFRNRCLRIFPGLIACVVLCAFCVGPIVSELSLSEYFASWSTYRYVYTTLLMFGANVYTLPGVFSTLPYPNTVNGSLWTIRYEIFMYIALLATVSTSKKSSYIMATAVAGLVAVWILGVHLNPKDPSALLWHFQAIGLGGAIARLAPFFLVGALWARAPRSALKPYVAILLAGAAYFFSNSAYAIVILWGVLPYCVLVIAYRSPQILNKFGQGNDYSYGVYLYAFPVQQTLSYLLYRNWWIHLVVSIVTTLALAVISWKLVEAPALRFKGKSSLPIEPQIAQPTGQ